jgi:hypothetical protein
MDGLLRFAIFIPASDRDLVVELVKRIAYDRDGMFHNVVFRCLEKDVLSQKPMKVVETIKYLNKLSM